MDKCWNPISKAILASLVAASANAASYQGTFTAAAVDIFDGSALSGTTFSVLPNGTPVLVERGPSASGAHGKARAELGSNGFMATSGAAGFSAWSDGFTVAGGSGAGELSISVSIHGSVVGGEADMFYGLYLSKVPFGMDSDVGINDSNAEAMLSNATLLLSHEINDADASPNATLSGKLKFNFGETFYLFSQMYGDVCTELEPGRTAPCTGGSEDFFHSAVFGLTAPGSAAVSALSGRQYAAAVPEPQAWVLCAMGLLALAMSSRRSQRAGD